MNSFAVQGGRLRAYLRFVTAVLYFFLARSVAQHTVAGLTSGPFAPLLTVALLAFLLIVVYASMGLLLEKQRSPVAAQGLPLRAGWSGEAGLGVAVGWGMAVACVVPLAMFGGIAIVLSTQAAAWGWLAVDLAYFACLALVEEVTFRGYGFQQFAAVVGQAGASLGFAAFYAILQALQPGSGKLSTTVAVALSLLLSLAYVRTRALWVSWGLNFAWKASRALVFGLAIAGGTAHSPVVAGDPMGPLWLTGDGYGLDGSWLALVVILAAIPVVYRVTRELDFVHNAPVFVPGGIPVDLDAAARKQHEAAMGPAAEKPLVQIQAMTAAAAKPENDDGPGAGI